MSRPQPAIDVVVYVGRPDARCEEQQLVRQQMHWHDEEHVAVGDRLQSRWPARRGCATHDRSCALQPRTKTPDHFDVQYQPPAAIASTAGSAACRRMRSCGCAATLAGLRGRAGRPGSMSAQTYGTHHAARPARTCRMPSSALNARPANGDSVCSLLYLWCVWCSSLHAGAGHPLLTQLGSTSGLTAQFKQGPPCWSLHAGG